MSSFIIGVLSDSHTRDELQREVLDRLVSQGSSYVLHLGDFGMPVNLEMLHNIDLPYASVFGNNDYGLIDMQQNFNIKTEPYYLKIKESKIKMMHLPYYLTPDSDIVLYGHTHKFSVEYKNSTLFLNPGEVCAREKNLSECATIEVFEDRYLVKYHYIVPDSNSWSVEEFSYRKKGA